MTTGLSTQGPSSAAVAALIARLRQFTAERDWDQFHSPKNLSTAIQIEAAELAALFLWKTDLESHSVAKENTPRLAEEAADTLIYLLLLCDKCEIDLIAATWDKIGKNESNYPIPISKGNARKHKAISS